MAQERNDIIFENQRVIIPSNKKEIISIYDDEKNDTPYLNTWLYIDLNEVDQPIYF